MVWDILHILLKKSTKIILCNANNQVGITRLNVLGAIFEVRDISLFFPSFTLSRMSYFSTNAKCDCFLRLLPTSITTVAVFSGDLACAWHLKTALGGTKTQFGESKCEGELMFLVDRSIVAPEKKRDSNLPSTVDSSNLVHSLFASVQFVIIFIEISQNLGSYFVSHKLSLQNIYRHGPATDRQ